MAADQNARQPDGQPEYNAYVTIDLSEIENHMSAVVSVLRLLKLTQRSRDSNLRRRDTRIPVLLQVSGPSTIFPAVSGVKQCIAASV